MSKNWYINFCEYDDMLHENNPYLAKGKMEVYLEKYPNDYFIMVHYAQTLIMLKEFKKAEELNSKLKDAMAIIKEQCGDEKASRIKNIIVQNEAKLLVIKKRYSKVLELIKHTNCLSGDNKRYLFYYCNIMLGNTKYDNELYHQYRFDQCFEYSEERLLEHVQKHTKEYDKDDKSSYLFANGFNLNEVLTEVKKYIDQDNYIFRGYTDDVYYFRYDNCGTCCGAELNYIKVVCLHGTSNIVNIEPTIEADDSMPYVNLNYLKGVPRRMSQIEKFYKKYNKEV